MVNARGALQGGNFLATNLTVMEPREGGGQGRAPAIRAAGQRPGGPGAQSQPQNRRPPDRNRQLRRSPQAASQN